MLLPLLAPGIPKFLPLIGVSRSIIYNAVAASTLYMWEYCTTLDVEIELIWRSSWNWATLIFCAIRYLALANVIVSMVMATNVSGVIHPSPSDCNSWFWFQVISIQNLVMGVETVLIARAFAFYGRNKILLGALVTLFICANAARFTVIVLLAPQVAIIPNPLPSNLPFGTCLIDEVPPLFATIWIPQLIPETILFFLVIFRLIWIQLEYQTTSSHVIMVLVRDGSWAFVLIFAGSLWLVLQFQISPPMGLVPLAWFTSILGFCGSRLILNLRSATNRIGLTDVQTFGPEYALNRAAAAHRHSRSGASVGQNSRHRDVVIV